MPRDKKIKRGIKDIEARVNSLTDAFYKGIVNADSLNKREKTIEAMEMLSPAQVSDSLDLFVSQLEDKSSMRETIKRIKRTYSGTYKAFYEEQMKLDARNFKSILDSVHTVSGSKLTSDVLDKIEMFPPDRVKKILDRYVSRHFNKFWVGLDFDDVLERDLDFGFNIIEQAEREARAEEKAGLALSGYDPLRTEASSVRIEKFNKRKDKAIKRITEERRKDFVNQYEPILNSLSDMCTSLGIERSGSLFCINKAYSENYKQFKEWEKVKHSILEDSTWQGVTSHEGKIPMGIQAMRRVIASNPQKGMDRLFEKIKKIAKTKCYKLARSIFSKSRAPDLQKFYSVLAKSKCINSFSGALNGEGHILSGVNEDLIRIKNESWSKLQVYINTDNNWAGMTSRADKIPVGIQAIRRLIARNPSLEIDHLYEKIRKISQGKSRDTGNMMGGLKTIFCKPRDQRLQQFYDELARSKDADSFCENFFDDAEHSSVYQSQVSRWRY
jgi:hypothetical protein